MLRSVLVGMDGSAYSEATVELGIRWAQRWNAVLVGLGGDGCSNDLQGPACAPRGHGL